MAVAGRAKSCHCKNSIFSILPKMRQRRFCGCRVIGTGFLDGRKTRTFVFAVVFFMRPSHQFQGHACLQTQYFSPADPNADYALHMQVSPDERFLRQRMFGGLPWDFKLPGDWRYCIFKTRDDPMNDKRLRVTFPSGKKHDFETHSFKDSYVPPCEL